MTYTAVGNTMLIMGTGTVQTYIGGLALAGQQGTDKVTFGTPSVVGLGTIIITTNDADDYVTSTVGGAWAGLVGTVTLDGGAGQDTLELAGGDDLTPGFLNPINVTNFENLVIAFNGSVTMTNSQHNQFTPASTIATGNNKITISDAFTGTTMAQIENYELAAGTGNHSYTIAQSNQTVTDLDATGGPNTANINGGLSNVTLIATAGASYIVNALSGGTNLKVVLDANDTVSLAGGHTGLDIFTDLGTDTVNVTGSVTGKIDGGTGTDTLHLNNTADIAGATLLGFEGLDFAPNAAVKMTGTFWDQFVGTNGSATGGHTVTGGTGIETVTLTDTENNVTTAFTGNLSAPIENYVLSSGANDFFRVNNGSTLYHAKVDLSGGGSDFVVLNDVSGAAFSGIDVSSTVVNFASGAGGDLLQIQKQNASISTGSFQTIVADATNVGATTKALVVNTSSTIMDDSWSQAEAQTALDEAINNIGTGNYAMTVYFTGATTGAYVMGVNIVTANTLTDAKIDLIGVLSNVANNTLTADNFT